MKAIIREGRSTLILLSWKDSNPHKRNENPVCYRYTTGHFSFCVAKVIHFFELANAKVSFLFNFALCFRAKDVTQCFVDALSVFIFGCQCALNGLVTAICQFF